MLYAGIGSRQTPNHVVNVMERVATVLARKGYTVKTGACKGADQAFAEGALKGYGRVHLCLPWPSYEKAWINNLHGDIHIQVIDLAYDKVAADSVYRYHPNPSALKQSVFKLHARNYLIITGVEFVICWTPNGEVSGGTGQAVRIANDLGIKVYNLGNPNTLQTFENRLEAYK